MEYYIMDPEPGKCDECGSPYPAGSSLKSVCFATGSSGFVAACCFHRFPEFVQFAEDGWKDSGVWERNEYYEPEHYGWQEFCDDYEKDNNSDE